MILLMIPTIILLVIEGMIGFKRGLVNNGVRFGFFVLGAVLAGFAAVKTATGAILKFSSLAGYQINTVSEITRLFSKEVNLGAAESYIGGMAGALALSAIIPVFFAFYFWVFKFIGWILYLIVAKVMKANNIGEGVSAPVESSDGSSIEALIPSWSRICGLLLGMFMGLLAGAFTVMPIVEPIKGMVNDDVFAAIEQIGDPNDADIAEMRNIAEKGTDFVTGVAMAPYRFTGTEWITSKVYTLLATVNVASTGARYEGAENQYVCVKTTLGELAKSAAKLYAAASSLESSDTATATSINSIKELADTALESDLLPDEAKLGLLNEGMAELKKSEDMSAFARFLPDEYESIEAVSSDIDALYRLAMDAEDMGVLDSIDKDGSVSSDVADLELTEEQIETLINDVRSLSMGEEAMKAMGDELISSGVITQELYDKATK